jgi:hypothetical protein
VPHGSGGIPPLPCRSGLSRERGPGSALRPGAANCFWPTAIVPKQRGGTEPSSGRVLTRQGPARWKVKARRTGGVEAIWSDRERLRYRLAGVGATTVVSFVGPTTLWEAAVRGVGVQSLSVEVRALPLLGGPSCAGDLR